MTAVVSSEPMAQSLIGTTQLIFRKLSEDTANATEKIAFPVMDEPYQNNLEAMLLR